MSGDERFGPGGSAGDGSPGAGGPAEEATASPGDPGGDPSHHRGRDHEPVPCDLCGHPMLEVHCKLTCRACGYQRDCSDP